MRSEKRQGKGNVIKRAFRDLDEDVIMIVDGDSTYDLSIAQSAIDKFVDEKLDYMNIRRVSEAKESYPFGHRFGNKALTGAIQFIFGRQITDMLSGYKIFHINSSNHFRFLPTVLKSKQKLPFMPWK